MFVGRIRTGSDSAEPLESQDADLARSSQFSSRSSQSSLVQKMPSVSVANPSLLAPPRFFYSFKPYPTQLRGQKEMLDAIDRKSAGVFFKQGTAAGKTVTLLSVVKYLLQQDASAATKRKEEQEQAADGDGGEDGGVLVAQSQAEVLAQREQAGDGAGTDVDMDGGGDGASAGDQVQNAGLGPLLDQAPAAPGAGQSASASSSSSVALGVVGAAQLPAGPSGSTSSPSFSATAAASADCTATSSTVFYSSRTHVQAANVLQEARTMRIPGLHVASRAQLCLVPAVRDSEDARGECLTLCASGLCNFYVHHDAKQEVKARGPLDAGRSMRMDKKPEFRDSDLAGQTLDIEDLLRLGKAQEICPYYGAQQAWRKGKAPLVVGTHSMLLTSRPGAVYLASVVDEAEEMLLTALSKTTIRITDIPQHNLREVLNGMQGKRPLGNTFPDNASDRWAQLFDASQFEGPKFETIRRIMASQGGALVQLDADGVVYLERKAAAPFINRGLNLYTGATMFPAPEGEFVKKYFTSDSAGPRKLAVISAPPLVRLKVHAIAHGPLAGYERPLAVNDPDEYTQFGGSSAQLWGSFLVAFMRRLAPVNFSAAPGDRRSWPFVLVACPSKEKARLLREAIGDQQYPVNVVTTTPSGSQVPTGLVIIANRGRFDAGWNPPRPVDAVVQCGLPWPAVNKAGALPWSDYEETLRAVLQFVGRAKRDAQSTRTPRVVLLDVRALMVGPEVYGAGHHFQAHGHAKQYFAEW